MSEVTREAEYCWEMHSGLNGLLELRQDWNALFQTIESPAYFQDWRWMHAVVKCLVKDCAHFVVLRKQGKVAMILPLHLDTGERAGINQAILSFPSHNHIVLSDLLYDASLFEPADLNSAITYLSNQDTHYWSLLELNGICENSLLGGLLLAAGSSLTEISQNAFFKVDNGEFEQTLSKKFIKNIKRLSNKAEKEVGEVQAVFCTDSESLPDTIGVFFELEASGWKGESGTKTAIKHHPELVSFYRELQESFSVDNSFSVNILEIGGMAAAAQLCIRSGAVWYILKIAYHHDLGKYGTGNILMLKFLQEVCLDHELREVNLVTSPPWADRWHLEKRPVYRYQHFNNNLKGQLARVTFGVKNKIKTIKQRERRKS